MCGLAFAYLPSCSPGELHARVTRALARLSHRGPDAQGVETIGSAVLGHRRLSIIDIRGSNQPMRAPGGRYSIVYNGEIYNYREIRAQLAQRWTFLSDGDTEVVLAGLTLDGPEFLQRLEGMWAIALWDSEAKSLLLARDRMGKKPLYYTALPAGIVCASELSGLKQLVPHSWQEDPDSTADFLRYGFYLPGTTAYLDIKEVLPGHVLHWSVAQHVQQTPYWTLPIERYRGTRTQAGEELRETLIDSTAKRLVADVEVGAFLSGGVDSSLLVGILSRHLSENSKTFTIGFAEESYDERQFARLVAREYGTQHYERTLNAFDPNALKQLVLEHFGQPFGDASVLPTALVSQLASEYVKVALSGDGGDELFSGYQRYQARVMLRWYTRLPAAVRKLIKRSVELFPEPQSHHSRSLLKKAHLFQHIIDREEREGPYVAPTAYSNRELAELAPDLRGRGHAPPGLTEVSTLDDIQRMMALDALVYLPQDILAKVDRASMAYSLEARAPFLDSRLVTLAFSCPREWHRRWFSGKRMLTDVFSDLLPVSVRRRRKQGFGVPLGAWFNTILGEELKLLMSEASGPLRRQYVDHLLEEHRAGRRDHGQRLWNIYIYLIWTAQRTAPAS
jgi:asparagine synthase (glutamine-hydrolysing)